jgi:outer membrane protein OmpA-like peptidoglycan-associated protein
VAALDGQPPGMSEEHLPEGKHDEAANGEAHDGGTTSKSGLPPAVALAFVIIALLGVLIVMVLKSGTFSSASDDGRLSALQADVDARRAELNRQRIAMGLSPIEGASEPIEDIATRLKKDADSLVALSVRFQQMIEEKDRLLSAANLQLLDSEKIRQSLFSENSRLQGDLNRALINGSDADRLRRDLADLKAQRDALSEDLAAARQKMLTMSAGASADDFADLKRRFDETLRAKEFFEARVKELESSLSQTKLFASSENELLPAAVELFRNLRLLEGKSDSEISSAYSSLAVQLGVDVKRTLNFATGSSVLTAADEEAIRALVADVPDGDLMLAIGYASETGNLDSNRVLSSDRATAAAQLISSVKRPGQLTQAVYLGQTDRFSSRIPERNQIVEIWQIRRK